MVGTSKYMTNRTATNTFTDTFVLMLLQICNFAAWQITTNFSVFRAFH